LPVGSACANYIDRLLQFLQPCLRRLSADKLAPAFDEWGKMLL